MKDEFFAYSQEKDHFKNKKITNELSDLSGLFLDQIDLNIKNNKPIVTLYPRSHLAILPLLAIKYTRKTNRDVLIITNEDSIINHLKNYQQLAKDNGRYEFMFTIPIIIEENGASIRIVNYMVPKRKRKGLVGELFQIANLMDIRKVVFCGYNMVDEGLSKNQVTLFEEIRNTLNIELDIGTIIFENIDTIFRNSQLKGYFINWCKNLIEAKKNIFIHGSYVYSNLFDGLNKDFDNTLIKINHYLIRTQITQQEGKIKSPFDIISKFSNENRIEIIGNIELQNLDIIEADIRSAMDALRKTSIPMYLKKSLYLLDALRNLIIHPSLYKFIMKDENGVYLYGNIEQYIQIVSKNLNEKDMGSRIFANNLLSSIITYYNIIKKTKRYGEEYHFSSKSKNSFLIDYLLELDKLGGKQSIAVVCYDKVELKIIADTINKIGLNHINIIPIYYKKVVEINDIFDFAIIPGAHRNINTFTQLINNFKSVKIISYAGVDKEFIKGQLNKIASVDWISDSISVMNKLSEEGNEVAESILNNIELEGKVELVPRNILEPKEVQYPELIDIDIDFSDRINDIQLDGKIQYREQPNKLVLKDTTSDEIIQIPCGEYSTFLKVIENKTYENILFGELEKGDMIMRFGDSEGDQIFKIMEELYGADEVVDFGIIKLWKSCFQNGLGKLKIKLENEQFNTKEITLLRLYQEYVKLCKENKFKERTYQSFLGWVKEKRIGPDNSSDVLIMGMIGDFPAIGEEYLVIHQEMNKLRRLHVIIGKQVNKIISMILSRKSTDNIHFQEQLLYDRIKFYEVVDILINLKKGL